ncbi:MAG TPA: sigma 54-interacting transcriptional regulator [Desulfobaccales bacterium]|nr:sigma 54-interacting transcriptional regulator [Desulfobaccales bacterium]
METDLNELELKVLHEISQIIGQALDLDQALQALLAILADCLAMQRAAVILKDPETGHLRICASHGLSPEGKLPGIDRLDEGVIGLICCTAHPFVVPVGSQEPRFLNKPQSLDLDKGQIAGMGAPIILQGAPIGVLSVDRLYGEDIALEEDIRFLGVVATLIVQFVSLNLQVRAREDHLRQENQSLRVELSEKSPDLVIVGGSPAIMEARQLIKKVAPVKAPVLLMGESGTGKTLFARVIHTLSPRAQYPFLKINCASLPENLLEIELFGIEKGASPGAVRAKPGRLEEADGGSLFLDEVEALSLPLQAKLLRFLQEREFERLGSARTRSVDVRIIAATTGDLTALTHAGSFREDLSYLLSVFLIRVPPLRDRREDIPPLLDHFMDKVSEEYGRRFYFTQKAQAVLQRHGWSGNVREMENLVERLCLMVEGSEIGLKALPAYVCPAGAPAEPADQAFLSRLKEMEKREIMAALERHHWIQSQAAMDLGLTLRQIGYRVKQFGLERLIKEQRGQGLGGKLKSLGHR